MENEKPGLNARAEEDRKSKTGLLRQLPDAVEEGGQDAHGGIGMKSFVRTTICPGLAGEAESANGAVAGLGNVSKSASRSASEFKLYSSNNTAELVWSIVNRKMLVNSEPAPMVKSRGTAFVSGMML